MKRLKSLLKKTTSEEVAAIPVSADNPIVYRYGVGTIVAYVAGPGGLVGVNVGEPIEIPENPLPDGDSKASAEFWKKYRELTKS